MERGKTVQAAIEALERRRRLREYGLGRGERLFGVSLYSEELHLAGKLDLLVVTQEASFPVDFKHTEGGVRRNHRVQIAAYAMLVEDALERSVHDGFIYLVPSDDIVRVPVLDEHRAEVLASLEAIRRMIGSEDFPDPTAVRARCQACEYRNYCADVW